MIVFVNIGCVSVCLQLWRISREVLLSTVCSCLTDSILHPGPGLLALLQTRNMVCGRSQACDSSHTDHSHFPTSILIAQVAWLTQITYNCLLAATWHVKSAKTRTAIEMHGAFSLLVPSWLDGVLIIIVFTSVPWILSLFVCVKLLW